jgi:hypothetical protein
MAIDAGRLKHLEFIQQAITRMANNSFLLKGWSVTLLSAILAIAASKDGLHKLVWIGFLPLLTFWLLDGYFLREERLYRKLWDQVSAQGPDALCNFTMDASAFSDQVQSWFRTCLSESLLVFHGVLFLVWLAISLAGR